MDKDIKNQIEIKGLVVNRIPSWAKTYLKERAKNEFSNDYGQALAYFIRMCEEYEVLKTKFFNSELALQLVSNSPKESKEDENPKDKFGEKLNVIGGKKSGKN